MNRRRWRIDLEPAMNSLADQAEKLPPDRRDALVEYIEQAASVSILLGCRSVRQEREQRMNNAVSGPETPQDAP